MSKLHIIILSALLFFSCSPQTTLDIKENNSAQISFSMDSGMVIQSVLQAFGLANANSPLFDENKIRASLSQSTLQVEEIAFPANTSLSLKANIQNIDSLVAGQNDLMSLTENNDSHIFTLVLSPTNIREVITLMPPETAMYLDLLFAPIFTGESMTKDEYLFLIGAAYGSAASTELQNAKLTLNILTPQPIIEVKSSNADSAQIDYKDNTATITFALATFLTDLRTTEYTLLW